MDGEPAELTVAEVRDHFSQVIDGSAVEGRVTFGVSGQGRERIAGIVPVGLAEACEEMFDEEDGRIARHRLDEVRAGTAEVMSLEEVKREAGL
ncbi:antitoxin of toxin-antitoxin stability system [Nocardiopsis sp. RSe5-2]|uniref:Antitoxin of toxin-antitoxin stability system n=1 Tax=Nocardiopsis endophytica TaxID=3018445 RepID=A0ABT4U6N7_9ACTN|nr:antitoxin of toxin-antitoxin stability system [Nocardiopsis endophytica]MDA2812609.1 antitoxin of toxin-antitoxin stability system [Nocardiopsis endophytica]